MFHRLSGSLTAVKSGEKHHSTLLLVSALTILAALAFTTGGHLNVDEGVYHLMVRDFAASGEFWLRNGYEEFPSAELAFPITPSHDGRLVSQYPLLYPILAAPLYALMGYKALFLINASALVGALWLTVWLARSLFPDKSIGAVAGVIFALSTYAWDYALAAMPHALSVLCVLAAVSFAVLALHRLEQRVSLLYALAAGLVVGLSVGIRLDTVFVLAALIAPFLFRVPWRPLHALAIVLGLLPGLFLMATLNEVRFNQFNPLSYGPGKAGNVASLLPYLALAAVGTSALAAIWFATRPRFQPLLRDNRRLLMWLLVALGGVVILVPQVSALTWRLLDGVFQLVVDFRVRDPGWQEPGLSRAPGGGMVYLGGLKKSLLQSCPYLVSLAIPAWMLWRGPRSRPAIAMLFLVPLSYIGVYGFFAWHGGQGLNLRYFLPTLPFLAILTAYAWRELTDGFTNQWDRWFAIVGLAILAVYAVVALPRRLELSEQETLYLSFPLVLSALLLGLVLLHIAGVSARIHALKKLTVLVLCAALFWPRIVTFAYDLPASYRKREVRAEFAQTLASAMAEDSLIFVSSAGPFFGLFEHPGVRIATPSRDDFEDFEAIARYHMAADRAVYAWLDPTMKADLERRGIWPRLRLRSLLHNDYGELVELLGFEEPLEIGSR